MGVNVLFSDRVRVVGSIDPDANAAGALTSAYADMSNYDQVMAIVQTGTLGTAATVDMKLVQATDSSGTGVKDITGKAITQLVKATNDDDQAIINCRADELDTANGFNHIAIVHTVGTATSDSGAILLGSCARYEPATDLASVVEIIA